MKVAIKKLVSRIILVLQILAILLLLGALILSVNGSEPIWALSLSAGLCVEIAILLHSHIVTSKDGEQTNE